jgi:hypothetical protein
MTNVSNKSYRGLVLWLIKRFCIEGGPSENYNKWD